MPTTNRDHALNGNLPHHDDEDDSYASVPALTPDQVKELLKQHGDRFRPILSALREQPWKELVSSRDIMDSLTAQGLDISERTLRLYLAEMADAGLIVRNGRRGYRLTDTGAEIAREMTVSRRLGSILAKMEETICQLGFDLSAKTGMVSINGYVIPRELVSPLCDEIEAVFKAGLSVGSHVLLVPPGEDILGREVPKDHIGIGTMCSINLASLLMRRQIPSYPIFGGLLSIDNGVPQHFLEMIRYDATTLSPNEIFIRANLTSVSRAATSGTGAITASYREVPNSALPALRQLAKDCETAGFPGILLVGRPGQPLLNIPVHEGRVGVVLTTGLNPVAGLWERGLQVGQGNATLRTDYSRPMVGPGPFEQLIHYSELRTEIAKLHSKGARAGETTKP